MRLPSSARAAHRFMAIVVFPAPPFWLTTAMITIAPFMCPPGHRFPLAQNVDSQLIMPGVNVLEIARSDRTLGRSGRQTWSETTASWKIHGLGRMLACDRRVRANVV